MTIDPSISLPLLLGLSHSTGSTEVNESDEGDNGNDTKHRYFLSQLHHLLSKSQGVKWQPHGRAFKILDVKSFTMAMNQGDDWDIHSHFKKEEFNLLNNDGADDGCWYKDGFTRGGINDVCVLDVATNKPTAEKAKKPKPAREKQENTERITQFMAVTATTDNALARRYLEMSGQNVEMAVTLFLESGGGFGFGSPGAESTAGEKDIDDAMDVDEEPDFYSLPYASEPPRQLPAGKIVVSALEEYWAYRTVRRALLNWIQSRRGKKPSLTTPPPQLNVGNNSQKHEHGTSHFLMKALIHPSVQIRRSAGRMFVHNIHQVRGMDKQNAVLGMQECLVILLHKIMFDEAPYESKLEENQYYYMGLTNSRSSIHEQANEGDPAVQLMGMLTSLVCDGGFSNALVADYIKTLEDGGDPNKVSTTCILLKSQLQELASFSIESFVASGGLRWACGSIIRLVHMLVHGPLNDDSVDDGSDSKSYQQRKKRWKNGGINKETIQTRLCLLIDLVYRLVLFGSVPSAVDRQGALTSIHGGEDDTSDRSSSKFLPNNDPQQKRKRSNLSQFYEMMSRATRDSGETSRTMALRNTLRSSLASRGVAATGADKDRGSNDIGGNKDKRINPDVAEENRLRKEHRKSSLERVHSVFWQTTLPAAMCVGKSHIHADSKDINQSTVEPYFGTLTPLACLIAAYEILRSPSTRSRFDDATNKAISLLSRLVDPAAGYCLVVSDPEIHWGLASLILDGKCVDKAEIISQESRSRKRARSDSQASQENQRIRSPMARSNPYTASPNDAGHRAKRQRERRTHISSLLERLTDSTRDARDNLTGSSAYSPAAASASSLLLRAGGPASAASSANRDGSLSRIIAAAEERSGFADHSTVRARAILDRSAGGASAGDWRLIDSIAENDAGDGEGVVLMDEEEDDNDTEFEEGGEDGPGDETEDLHDDPDDEDGEDDDDDGDEDHGDEHGEESEGEDSIFDDAVILMDQVAAAGNDDRDQQRNNPHRQSSAKSHTRDGALSLTGKKEQVLIAAMSVLNSPARNSNTTPVRERSVKPSSIFSQPPAIFRSPLLTLSSEQSLMQSMCDIVKPPKKPLNLKVFLRRAPTQEEFFRGAVSRNPINLSSLKTGTSGGGDNAEPTFKDLRVHIAKDLQMEDSAELLELLVASKIIDVNVKLRVAQQVLWKKYVMENSTSASSMVAGAGPGHQMINTGSGLSMIFSSSGLSGRLRGSDSDELDVSQLPPMVVTYRLAGVDGEATEDNVEKSDLEDPEAINITCPKALEIKMEKEFGITRRIADDGGISTILASVQSFIDEVTSRIRRDEIQLRRRGPSATDENVTRVNFAKSAPCPGLILLRHCANLASNRKILLAARAPTMLLRMLLDVLNAMNRSPNRRQRSLTFDGTSSHSMDIDETPRNIRDNSSSPAESNPTTNALQEIIEMLASDISAEVSNEASNSLPKSDSFVNLTQTEGNGDQNTLLLVLKSLRSANLSPPLRKVISKLLPFLTYGQIDQSEKLASFFDHYIKLESIATSDSNYDFDMMNTFIDTAINLPPVGVCDNLRQALIANGFIDKVKSFVMLQAPLQPPPWSPALYPKKSPTKKATDDSKLKEQWKTYFDRPGLIEAIKILIGLCFKHDATQIKLSVRQTGDDVMDLLTLCHWVESTSDNDSSGIKMNGLGILAETLLDNLKEGNDKVSEKISAIRKSTQNRKKEIAEERRNRALVGMSAFGKLAGSAVAADSAELRSTSMFASMFGLSAFSSSSPRRTRTSSKDAQSEGKASQPSWMAEMEAMEEESGVTCAVCQEGRTLQPSELLGLYAYMKKVTIPSSQGGERGDIDGTVMLLSLPVTCPRSLVGFGIESFFKRGKVAANAISGTAGALTAMASTSISSNSSNRTSFVTTVSAGNAIHCNCHARAKAADRSHPKAPKSEWEGASLRNSRVTCNIILPLVSSKASNVPLIAVESSLGEVNTITTNILGSRPKSMLWNVLHDIRLLMLRMSYGEALNADCGGGSSSSNFLLMLYQLYTANMLWNNADIDDTQVTKHARGLSPGFIAASSIVDSVDFTRQDNRSKRLEKGVTDAAPMAALCCILFCNSVDDGLSGSSMWKLHHDKFLAGLLKCAGHRKSMGVSDSGCATTRGISTGSKKKVEKTRSFIDWGSENDSTTGGAAKKKSYGRSILEDYAVALRPMITFYAVLGSLSKEFVVNDTDENTLGASERLASKLESCLKASNIVDLLDLAEITMDHDVICKHFERGLLIRGEV